MLMVMFSMPFTFCYAVGFEDEEAARTRAVGEEFTAVARTRERSGTREAVEVLLVGTDEAGFHGLHQGLHQRHLLWIFLVQLIVVDDGKLHNLSLCISLLVEREIICVVIS